MKWMFILLLSAQILILCVFVVQSILQRKSCNAHRNSTNANCDEFDVIIAAHENIELVKNCLSNVLSAGFHNIIICIDGDNQNIASILKAEYPSVQIVSNEHSLGKIKSQLRCLKISSKEKVLILDADISLIKDEINGFISYYNESKVDFLCPYSVGVSTRMNSLLFIIAETDRHMRQRVVRAGRDAYGVSNLSGYCMLANREKYIDIIDTEAIQDDVVATINLLQKNYSVRTYHKAVCSEVERTELWSYLLQKTRWTAGNIVLIKSYHKLFKATSISKSLAFTSSFLLWYWALWVDFFAFIAALFHPILFIPLALEAFIKSVGLTCAAKPETRYMAIILYLVAWPVFSTICLFMSPYYLSGRIVEQKTRR